jgi:hypothetical protein
VVILIDALVDVDSFDEICVGKIKQLSSLVFSLHFLCPFHPVPSLFCKYLRPEQRRFLQINGLLSIGNNKSFLQNVIG